MFRLLRALYDFYTVIFSIILSMPNLETSFFLKQLTLILFFSKHISNLSRKQVFLFILISLH